MSKLVLGASFTSETFNEGRLRPVGWRGSLSHVGEVDAA